MEEKKKNGVLFREIIHSTELVIFCKVTSNWIRTLKLILQDKHQKEIKYILLTHFENKAFSKA